MYMNDAIFLLWSINVNLLVLLFLLVLLVLNIITLQLVILLVLKSHNNW